MSSETDQSRAGGDPSDWPKPSSDQPRVIARRRRIALPLLHWIILLLVLAELGLGWSQPYWPQGFRYLPLIAPLHVSLGISLAVLVVGALIWWALTSSPDSAASQPSWLRIPLRSAVFLLYLLVVLALATGYLSLVFAGKPIHFWTLSLPSWGGTDTNLSALFGIWHDGTAIVLAVLVALYLLLRLAVALRRPATPAPPTSSSVLPNRDGLIPVPNPDETVPHGGAPTPAHLSLAGHLRIFGAVAFWLEVPLGLVAALLLFVAASSHYYAENQLKLPSALSWAEGVVWAHIATGILILTVIGFYLCVRWARSLKTGVEPARTLQRIKRLITSINFGSSLGVSIAILGTAFSIALLIAKTVSQPPGIAITDPQKIVRAVDVFVLLANFLIVVAHFLGLLIGLWVLSRIHRSE